jgi:hypothetical protein
MTKAELLEIARQGRPHVKYAAHRTADVIAAYSEEHGRFIAVACRAISNEWIAMPFEILIDGKPTYTDADFAD